MFFLYITNWFSLILTYGSCVSLVSSRTLLTILSRLQFTTATIRASPFCVTVPFYKTLALIKVNSSVSRIIALSYLLSSPPRNLDVALEF